MFFLSVGDDRSSRRSSATSQRSRSGSHGSRSFSRSPRLGGDGERQVSLELGQNGNDIHHKPTFWFLKKWHHLSFISKFLIIREILLILPCYLVINLFSGSSWFWTRFPKPNKLCCSIIEFTMCGVGLEIYTEKKTELFLFSRYQVCTGILC